MCAGSELLALAHDVNGMQDAVSNRAVMCGTTCVRGEWPLGHSVVAALQRGARSVGRWLTFFAGFRFDSVSITDDEDALLDLELAAPHQHHPRSHAACGCGTAGCLGCRGARAAPRRVDGGTDAVRCGCICTGKRAAVLEPEAGPVAEGRFGRGERGGHTASREARSQPSVVPEYSASLAGFGSEQMDLMRGVYGMDLESHRQQSSSSTPQNPFVDFGLPMEDAPAVQGAASLPSSGPPVGARADPLARPLDMPAVEEGDEAVGLPRRGPARAVGKALRSAASKLGGGGGGGSSASPERRQSNQNALPAVPAGPPGGGSPDPLAPGSADVADAAEEQQDPVVITIPEEGTDTEHTAVSDAIRLQRRSPFDHTDPGAQHVPHSAACRWSARADSTSSGPGRRDSERAPVPPGLACTMDVRRTNLQRSLALSQRSLSRMSMVESQAGPPPDW